MKEKSFVLVEITFFRSNFCEKSPIKKTLIQIWRLLTLFFCFPLKIWRLLCFFSSKNSFRSIWTGLCVFFRQCAKIRPQKTRCNLNLNFFLFFFGLAFSVDHEHRTFTFGPHCLNLATSNYIFFP
jgi:hypothetical protein